MNQFGQTAAFPERERLPFSCDAEECRILGSSGDRTVHTAGSDQPTEQWSRKIQSGQLDKIRFHFSKRIYSFVLFNATLPKRSGYLSLARHSPPRKFNFPQSKEPASHAII